MRLAVADAVLDVRHRLVLQLCISCDRCVACVCLAALSKTTSLLGLTDVFRSLLKYPSGLKLEKQQELDESPLVRCIPFVMCDVVITGFML